MNSSFRIVLLRFYLSKLNSAFRVQFHDVNFGDSMLEANSIVQKLVPELQVVEFLLFINWKKAVWLHTSSLICEISLFFLWVHSGYGWALGYTKHWIRLCFCCCFLSLSVLLLRPCRYAWYTCAVFMINAIILEVM